MHPVWSYPFRHARLGRFLVSSLLAFLLSFSPIFPLITWYGIATTLSVIAATLAPTPSLLDDARDKPTPPSSLPVSPTPSPTVAEPLTTTVEHILTEVSEAVPAISLGDETNAPVHSQVVLPELRQQAELIHLPVTVVSAAELLVLPEPDVPATADLTFALKVELPRELVRRQGATAGAAPAIEAAAEAVLETPPLEELPTGSVPPSVAEILTPSPSPSPFDDVRGKPSPTPISSFTPLSELDGEANESFPAEPSPAPFDTPPVPSPSPLVRLWQFLTAHTPTVSAALFPPEEAPATAVAVTVTDPLGEPVTIIPVITEEAGQALVRIPQAPTQFRPGKYHLMVSVVEGDHVLQAEQDFTWGVLALNLNQSTYEPGETASIGMAVLDDAGHTLCDADLTLVITAPSGAVTTLSTAEQSITTSPTCVDQSVTDLPDYATSYTPQELGTYALKLTAVTANGTREMQQFFTVESEAPYIVSRQGSMRIFPLAAYTMKVTVTAAQDFRGKLTETVPGSFALSAATLTRSGTTERGNWSLDIHPDETTKRLVWDNVELSAGQSATLSYTYDAPDISPEFYLLGPLEVISSSGTDNDTPVWLEPRAWQIAADIITNGANAIDALGQYDDNLTTPGPIYTKGTGQDAPNRLGLNAPWSDPALDSVNNRLFVPDSSNNRVLVYNLNADDTLIDRIPDNVLGQANFYTNASATTQAGLSFPTGLAYDSTNQRLFVVDSDNSRVLVFDVTAITDGENAVNVLGQANFTSSGPATTQAGLNFPHKAAYDSTNSRLFVADSGNSRVLVFDVTAITNGENAVNILGKTSFTSSLPATTQSGMSDPIGVAYDSTNSRLFVAEEGNHRVTVFDVTAITDGENAVNVLGQANFTSAGSATTQSGMTSPRGVAYDSTNSRLFVPERGNHRVTVFDVTAITDGENAVNVLGQANFTSSSSATTQAGMSSPRGAAYDATNNLLFVTASGNHRITVYDVTAITDGENAVDALGQYDNSLSAPAPIYTKGSAHNAPNRLGMSVTQGGVIFDSTNDRLFVSDSGNDRVLVYNLNANDTLIDRIPDNVLGQANFYTNTGATTQAGLNTPLGLAYDSTNQRLFVTDASNNRVVIYDVTAITDGENAVNVLGQANFTTATAATTQAGMSSPRGVAYDSANQRLFVGDSTNNRVVVFDVTAITDGENAVNVLGQANFTSSGAATTQAGMNNPQGLAYDSTNSRLFVADSSNNRVTTFDVTAITDGENAANVLGQTSFTVSTAATTQAGMSTPSAAAYDSTNSRLFVSATGNDRVTTYNVASITNGESAVNVLGQANFTSSGEATTQAGMADPHGLAYDSTNSRLYVNDTNNDRIIVHDAADPTITWDGGGTDGTCGGGAGDGNKWSCAANWSGDVVPTSAHIATFDGTSTKNATIDANIDVYGIDINTGYTGTITQATGVTVTVGSGGYDQAAGTFTGSNSAIDINGAWALSGGAFTSTSGALSVSDAFTISGGTFTHNSGTVQFDTTAATITPSTASFNNVSFTSAVTKTIAASNTITIVGTLTLTDGSVSQTTIPATGSIAAQGDITQASTFDGGTGRLEITGTATQTFTGNATTTAGNLPDTEIDKSGGTLTLTGTIRTIGQGAGAWTYTTGTLDAGTSTVVMNGAMTITGSHTLNNVSLLTSGTRTIANNNTLTVTGTLTLTDGSINQTTIPATGSIAAQGNITQASTFDGGTGRLEITGSAAQTFTGNATTSAGNLPDLEIDKSAETLTLTGTIRTTGQGADAWTYTTGTLAAGTSTVVMDGAMTITGSHTLNNVSLLTSGTRTVASGTTLTIVGTLTLTDGQINTGTVAAQGNITQGSAFDGGTGRLEITGTATQTFTGNATTTAGSLSRVEINKSGGTLTLAGTIRTSGQGPDAWTYTAGTVAPGTSTVVFDGGTTVTGTQTFNNLVVQGFMTVADGNTLTVTGTLTLTSGTIVQTTIPATGSIAAQGDITQASTFGGGTGRLEITGSANQTFTGSAADSTGLLPNLEIDKSGGTLTFTGTIRTAVDWTYTAGTLDATTNDSTVIFGGASTINITGSHTLDNVTFGDNFQVIVNIADNTTLTIAGTLAHTKAQINQTTVPAAGSLAAQGDVTVGSAAPGGTAALTFSGGNAQTYTDNGGTKTTGTVTVNKTAGSAVTLATAMSYTGTGQDLTITSGTLDLAGFNLTIADVLTVNGGTLTGETGAVDVNGSVVLSSGTLTAPSGAFTVAGDFTHSSGTFTHNSGTLTLDGPDQTLAGATTFHNLTKTVATARTLTFPTGSANKQTIVGTLTLQGASGALLSLRSASTGTQWQFDPQGTRTLSFLDVQDSHNTNSTSIATAGFNITDSGNNTGWSFNPEPPSNFAGTAISGTAITWTWTDNATDETGFKLLDASDTVIATINTANATSYTETGLAAGTDYSRKLIAFNGAGESAATSTVTVTTLTSPPTAPELRSPSNEALLNTNLPTFSWNKSTDNDDGMATYTLTLGSLVLSGIPASGSSASDPGSKTHVATSYTAQYFNENDGNPDNDYIALTLKDSERADIPLTDGEHSWFVTAHDTAGNTTTSASRSFTVDTQAPTIGSISFSPPALLRSGTYRLQSGSLAVTIPLTDTQALQEATVTFAQARTLFGLITSYTTLQSSTYALSGTARTIIFAPREALTAGETYRINITVTDTAGNRRLQDLTLVVLTPEEAAREAVIELDAETTPIDIIIEKLREALPDAPLSLPDLQASALLRRDLQAEHFTAFWQGLLGNRLIAWVLDHLGGFPRALLATIDITQSLWERLLALAIRIAVAAGTMIRDTSLALVHGVVASVDRVALETTTAQRIVRLQTARGLAQLGALLAQLTPTLGEPLQQVGESLALSPDIGMEYREERLTTQAQVSRINTQLQAVGSFFRAGWETGRETRVRTGLKNRQELTQGTERLLGPVGRLTKTLALKTRATYELWLDTTPTHISNVRVTKLTPTSATLEWDTNHLVRSTKVNYGTTTNYNQEVIIDALADHHRVTIANLLPRTTYYFEVTNQGSRNYVFDAYYTLTTPAQDEPSPPTPLAPQDAVVTASEPVSVYGEPVPTATIITTLSPGTRLRALNEQLGWISVLLPSGQEGWLQADYIQLQLHEGVSAQSNHDTL
ncbi:MAG: beta-propeller fold lactonase family protein [Candidatus Andersenbacteria bacterium]